MTKEDKKLLLADLCARLPYGVKVDLFGQSKELIGVLNDIISVGYDINDYEDAPIEDIKPYLRPMSSMTEEEKDYYDSITYTEDETHFKGVWCNTVVDWLNAHHFDYCGLIEKGLALEAPEDMYKMETQEPTERFGKQELTQKLNAIKSDIQGMYIPNKPLCKKLSQEKLKTKFGFDRLDNLRHDIFKGSHMRTYRFGADENVWTFPGGVEEKIEDDKDYKVWYTWHDASDPADMSTYHHVYYIEEVSAGKMAVLKFLKQLISEID